MWIDRCLLRTLQLDASCPRLSNTADERGIKNKGEGVCQKMRRTVVKCLLDITWLLYTPNSQELDKTVPIKSSSMDGRGAIEAQQLHEFW